MEELLVAPMDWELRDIFSQCIFILLFPPVYEGLFLASGNLQESQAKSPIISSKIFRVEAVVVKSIVLGLIFLFTMFKDG